MRDKQKRLIEIKTRMEEIYSTLRPDMHIDEYKLLYTEAVKLAAEGTGLACGRNITGDEIISKYKKDRITRLRKNLIPRFILLGLLIIINSAFVIKGGAILCNLIESGLLGWVLCSVLIMPTLKKIWCVKNL